jgi:hypothetical protein
MKRLLLALTAIGLVGIAVAWSHSQNPPGGSPTADLRVQIEERNPWTHLRLNNGSDEFQFAIVSDRTGGHRGRIFSQAVDQLNLLQPEFVVSVGDLIEGYSEERAKLESEWREFQSYVCRLQMPFFYVPGNHDVSNPFMAKLWEEKFGRCYYHFVYRDVLFLVLNSDDPPEKSVISESQIAYVERVLAENRGVRWTFVFLHKPLWVIGDGAKNGWGAVEKALAGRPYTVFAGHVHRFQKFVRQGQNYYQLATTGGGSKLRGIRHGEFDQIAWVTMKKHGPVLANILLDGIYTADMKQPISDEAGVTVHNRKPVHPVSGKVYFEGCPTPNAYVTFHLIDGKRFTRAADALLESDGSFTLSTYTAFDGAPVGDYAVTVTWSSPLFDEQGRRGPNLLPERYSKPETTDLRAKVVSGRNEFIFELKK